MAKYVTILCVDGEAGRFFVDLLRTLNKPNYFEALLAPTFEAKTPDPRSPGDTIVCNLPFYKKSFDPIGHWICCRDDVSDDIAPDVEQCAKFLGCDAFLEQETRVSDNAEKTLVEAVCCICGASRLYDTKTPTPGCCEYDGGRGRFGVPLPMYDGNGQRHSNYVRLGARFAVPYQRVPVQDFVRVFGKVYFVDGELVFPRWRDTTFETQHVNSNPRNNMTIGDFAQRNGGPTYLPGYYA